MRFSLITVALCAAVLSPVATFGHEGHHHDDDATNSTIMDPEVSAIVISIDGDTFTYLVPQASVSLGSHTINDSGSPVSTGLAHFDNQSSIYVSPIEDISSIYVAPVEDISGIYADPIGDISGIYVGPVEDISSIYVGPVEGVSGIYDDPIEDISSIYVGPVEDISSIYVGPVEDISSIYVGPVEDISSIYVGPIEAISTERAGRSNSSTDGFTTYTLSLSTGTNRTGSPMDPTATDDSAAPTDVTGIAVRTTPAAAAMVAFIAAGLAVLEL